MGCEAPREHTRGLTWTGRGGASGALRRASRVGRKRRLRRWRASLGSQRLPPIPEKVLKCSERSAPRQLHHVQTLGLCQQRALLQWGLGLCISSRCPGTMLMLWSVDCTVSSDTFLGGP